jgi:hypothetical protein
MKETQLTFVSVLRSFGFKKVKWEKCPQGFKQANYPCYSHPSINSWAEVYPKEQYMLLQDEHLNKNHWLGKHFNTPKDLYNYMKKWYNSNKS